ncbi:MULTISPECIES: hypothetical protein [Pseudomonas syringae group]|uniref:Uncharacterized protein n=2 Tax=Pseudomonas syringae group TaxID=136849 RepID=A0A3M3G561_PSESG|nr:MULTISPECIES: hypothetical protein [Pseudomonas syringae group]RMM69125.1 hypothetical protein ALQ73_200176 [Pseudomonas savastanoi pv. glycinea]
MSDVLNESSQENATLKLGLEAIRLLSQTAEACSMYVIEQGHSPELIKFAMHCSDRAEHLAQYFIETHTESSVLNSVLDDLSWLTQFDNLIEQLRLKVTRNVPSRDDLDKLKMRIMTRELSVESIEWIEEANKLKSALTLHALTDYLTNTSYADIARIAGESFNAIPEKEQASIIRTLASDLGEKLRSKSAV